MNIKTIKILLVEDNPGDVRLIKTYLEGSGLQTFQVDHVQRLEDALDYLNNGTYQAVLLDMGLPDSQGIDSFRVVQESAPEVPVVVLTGHNDEDLALEIVQQGAQDYLVKDRINDYSLPRALRYAVERSRIQGALHEQERQLSVLMKNLQGMVYRCYNEPGWPMLFVSEGARSLTGYQPEEIMVGGGIEYGEIIHPQDREKVWKAVQKAVEGDSSFKIEYRIITKDRCVKWVREEGRAVGTEYDHLALEGYISDITDRVQSKQALEASESRYRLLAETAQDYIVVHDLDGRITYLNQSGLAFSGYTEEEILHQPISTFVPEDELDKLIHRRRDRQEGNHQQFLYESVFVDKHGLRVPVEVSSSPIVIEGEVQGVLLVARDIRERVEAEQAIRENERRYRRMFNATPLSIWVEDFTDVMERIRALEERGVTDLEAYLDDHPGFLDELGKLITINDINEETLFLFDAQEKEELLGSMDKITTPAAREILQDEILAIRRGETFFEGETIYRTLSGERIDIYLRMAIPAEEEGLDSVLVSMLDITDRKRAEGQLRQSEQKYRNLYNSIRDGLLLANTDREIIDCNPAFTDMFGYSLDEIRGKKTKTVYANQTEYEELGRALREHEGDKDFVYAVNYRTKSGRVFPGETSIFYLRDEKGEVEAFVGMIRDITERKNAREALEESEEKFRTIFNNANDAIFLHRFTEEGKPGIFIEVNQVACDMLGYTREEMKSMSPYDIVDMGSVPKEKGILEGLLGDQSATYELTHLAKDGTTVPVEISSHVFKLHNQHVVLSVARDIRERKKAQQKLKDSEERYRTLFESVPIGLYRTTPDGEITDVNMPLVKMLGYPDRESLLEANTPDFYVDPEEQSRWQEIMEREGVVKGFETRFFRHDGTIIWVQDNTRSIHDGDGNLIAYQGSLENITRRKEAEQENKQHTERLHVLREVGLKINRELDEEELLDLIVEQAIGLVGGKAGAFDRLNREKGVLELEVFSGYATHPEEATMARGEGLVGRVWSRMETIRVDDYAEWEGHHPQWVNHVGHSAVIGVPVRSGESLHGVLEVIRDEGTPFSHDEMHLLELFASQAAVAIQNAELFEHAQDRLSRLRALREIDETISGSLDLKTTLNVLLDRMLHSLDIDAGSILLYEPSLQMLDYVTGFGFRSEAIPRSKIRIGEGQAGKAALERELVHIPDLTLETVHYERARLIRQEDFVTYFGVPLIAKGEIVGVLEVFNRSHLDPPLEWMDFLETLAGQAAIAIDRLNLFNNLERSNMDLIRAYNEVIEGWARALELRDKETEGHSRRVVSMTMAMAKELGVPDGDLADIRQGALLHDIGKMGIPDSILQKPGELTEEEWDLMRKHPTFAYEMLSPIDHLKSALDIPYCHHERWDGSGYPRGLEGEEIPLPARIFAVVDVWDALRSDRPYREAWSDEKALAYIKEQSGKQFDPQVVEAFLEIIGQDH